MRTYISDAVVLGGTTRGCASNYFLRKRKFEEISPYEQVNGLMLYGLHFTDMIPTFVDVELGVKQCNSKKVTGFLTNLN